jgi:hypothetical protein
MLPTIAIIVEVLIKFVTLVTSVLTSYAALRALRTKVKKQ